MNRHGPQAHPRRCGSSNLHLKGNIQRKLAARDECTCGHWENQRRRGQIGCLRAPNARSTLAFSSRRPGSRAEGERTRGSEPRGPHFPPHSPLLLTPPVAGVGDHSPGRRTPASRRGCKRSRGPFNLRGIARPRPADMTSRASRTAESASLSLW